ncbi:Pr6Pr family membrane protein [Pedobacter gandavensis]|uniref:Pr6Pr family membrane protein n=1 Tax=Pedobacter gandavensis TaxID=2679963 RepID=UPI00292CB545|nr:Pr6Pr family membrane protein [Pedobacter gandavensis]
MNQKHERANKLLLMTGIFTGWFALITQLYLIIVNNQITIIEAVTRYFSYFTILTNIMVALCFTLLWLNFDKKEQRFYSNPKNLAAVALYISVVGIIYNLILRFTWQPKGIQLLVDELLHAFLPALFLIYWLIFAPKSNLKSKNALEWLIYPFAYLVFILARGAISGFYPYPFMDVNTFGYDKVLLNSFYLLMVFLVLSLLLIWVGKLITNRHKKTRF